MTPVAKMSPEEIEIWLPKYGYTYPEVLGRGLCTKFWYRGILYKLGDIVDLLPNDPHTSTVRIISAGSMVTASKHVGRSGKHSRRAIVVEVIHPWSPSTGYQVGKTQGIFLWEGPGNEHEHMRHNALLCLAGIK